MYYISFKLYYIACISPTLYIFFCTYNEEKLSNIWELFCYFEVIISNLELPDILGRVGEITGMQRCVLFCFVFEKRVGFRKLPINHQRQQFEWCIFSVLMKWTLVISVKSPKRSTMLFKCRQTLLLQRMTKYLTNSLWTPCYKATNGEIKELHRLLALEKLNKRVEKKNVE